MSDPASLATLDVLTKIGAPAVYTDANLVALVACGRSISVSNAATATLPAARTYGFPW
jgi:hypothetical protein